jgi:hypothetical protein
MRVKIINRVPLPGEHGNVYTPEKGAVVQVPDPVGKALLRGKDAELVADKPRPRGTKDLGAAPQNKGAGEKAEDAGVLFRGRLDPLADTPTSTPPRSRKKRK